MHIGTLWLREGLRGTQVPRGPGVDRREPGGRGYEGIANGTALGLLEVWGVGPEMVARAVAPDNDSLRVPIICGLGQAGPARCTTLAMRGERDIDDENKPDG